MVSYRDSGMKIYTKTGDKGATGLRGGARVSKDHPRVAAYGDVDELNAAVGAVLAGLPESKTYDPVRKDLRRIQSELFVTGAVLSEPKAGSASRDFPANRALWLESRMDRMTRDLPPLDRFILPGGGPAGAGLHVCRTVCRRAERSVLAVGKGKPPPGVVVYLNRLSDYLFTAARWVNRKAHKTETPWKGL